MSKLYVVEVAELAGVQSVDGAVAVFPVPTLAEYSITVSAGSSGGPNLQPATKWVELSCDTTCSFAIGPTATASAGLSNARLNANDRVIRRVPYQPQSVTAGASVLTTAYAIFTTANV
jgi:hypothetical protein